MNKYVHVGYAPTVLTLYLLRYVTNLLTYFLLCFPQSCCRRVGPELLIKWRVLEIVLVKI